MKKLKILPFLVLCLFTLNVFSVNANATDSLDVDVKEVANNETSATLEITKDDNVKYVRLPNGNYVTDSTTTYIVDKNGTYDFAYETLDGSLDIATMTVDDIRVSYLITNTQNVSLTLNSEDLLSGMGYMKFRNEVGTYSNFEPYTTKKSWVLDSNEGLKTVFAVFRDIAGNETTEVFDKIILDKTGPTTSFTINDGAAYTKTQNVTLKINALDNYSYPKTLFISNDNINWAQMPYTPTVNWALTSSPGPKTVYVKTVDNVGNVGNVASNNIYFDNVLPYGTVKINNGASLTNSRNVTLNMTINDIHSGVKRATIIENSRVYNLPNVPANVKNYTLNMPWTLQMGATGQVILEIEDNAGNVYRTNSNVITIATLTVTQLRLTNVVNPSVSSFVPVTWPFVAQEMKAGANISFEIKYSLELDSTTTANVGGEYYLEVVGDNNYRKLVQATYSDKLTNGFSATLKIPADAPKNAKVYLSSKLTATLKNSTETFTNEAYFPNQNEKALIGLISGNIKEDIIFNEIN